MTQYTLVPNKATELLAHNGRLVGKIHIRLKAVDSLRWIVRLGVVIVVPLTGSRILGPACRDPVRGLVKGFRCTVRSHQSGKIKGAEPFVFK